MKPKWFFLCQAGSWTKDVPCCMQSDPFFLRTYLHEHGKIDFSLAENIEVPVRVERGWLIQEGLPVCEAIQLSHSHEPSSVIRQPPSTVVYNSLSLIYYSLLAIDHPPSIMIHHDPLASLLKRIPDKKSQLRFLTPRWWDC